MESKGEILIYQSPQGITKVDVRMQDETVWLSQNQMTELFQTSVPNINMHIRNIYEEGELTDNPTIKKSFIVSCPKIGLH